jgi:hypothetical protein
MGDKRKELAIYRYSSIGFKTYVITSGVISSISGIIIIKNIPYSYIELLKITLSIEFNQLSFVLAVIAATIAMDASLLSNLSKQHEDYSIIKMLNEDSKRIKVEIFSSVIGIHFFIIGAFIEQWINEGIKDNVINISDNIIGSMFIIGSIFISLKIYLAMSRKKRYKSKLKRNS